MTSDRRFEQDLPDLLAQLAPGPAPDYRDDIVRQTARIRQRPAWTFPERWLPMTAVTSRAAAALRFPVRIVALVALLIIAMVVSALLIAGSRPRLPAPFGLAANGHVAYAADGDIYTADPVSGASTAVVTGPETDLAPAWSRDGTHLVFERKVSGTTGFGELYVASSDGREVIAVTPEPRLELASYAFSPDGRQVVFTSGPEDLVTVSGSADTELWIANVDGSGLRRLDVGIGVRWPSYRAPDGAEIVFTDDAAPAVGNGLYAVDVASGVVRTILAPTPGVGRDVVSVAPDGSRIAYSASTTDPDRNTYRVHVVAADGTGDVPLPLPAAATFQDAPAWSNDGTRLVVVRGYGARNEDMALAAVPADGSGTGVETARGLTGCCDTANEWAPNDRSILTLPIDLHGRPVQQLLWDPSTGESQPAPYVATSEPAWQRRAP